MFPKQRETSFWEKGMNLSGISPETVEGEAPIRSAGSRQQRLLGVEYDLSGAKRRAQAEGSFRSVGEHLAQERQFAFDQGV